MSGIGRLAARAWAAPTHARGGLARVLALALLVAMVLPVLMTVLVQPARADDKSDDRDNYSLYQLASNASTYFSEENSPEGKDKPQDRMNEDWRAITADPATGGDMLGYADPKLSAFNVVGWLFAEATGSTQTIGYDTLTTSGSGDGKNVYAGMLDYGHFGATNADLGLDTMSSGILGQLLAMIGGSVMWLLYALALAVGTLFYLIIQLLKGLNPFVWFYRAVAGVADASGSTNSAHQQGLADAMACSTDPTTLAEACSKGGGVWAGLQSWVSGWYGLLQSIAWEALVPLFIAFLLLGLVLFKKMDRGSAIKKLVVRVVFIGIGLPLLGSMYTGVLDKFDDSLLGQHSGPTRVVLSTYVDFEAWMMNDRLGIPDAAVIAWDSGQASNEAMMSVRTSALAINKQSHGSTFNDLQVGDRASDAKTAWANSITGMTGGSADDFTAVASTFGILNDYISGQITSASDFESGVKSSITNLAVSGDVKKEWFIDKRSYGDSDNFGGHGETNYVPTNHPVLAVNGAGLTSSSPGGSTTSFTTPGTKQGCGVSVWENESPVSCNMSALSAYNYLNTEFDPDSMTMFSSNNATSGLTREDHMSVSQVGTGPAKFMYWHNAGTVLGSIVLLGFWYAIGMLVGAVKRSFSLVAAVPFATLGAIAAISKVIVYSVALILEVLVTLFMYQFVSEVLISIPDIISGPVSSWMSKDGLWGSGLLGGIVVVILTLVSSLLVTGITFALLRVRKVVLQAMDEVFTKLVDKFLETNTAPRPDRSGLLPALASGAGAGAGMALGNRLASGIGDRLGGPKSPKPSGRPTGETASTNAGGLNGDQKSLSAGKGLLALEAGSDDRHEDGPGAAGGPDGPDGPRSHPGGRGGDGRALPAGSSVGPGDKGGPLQLTGGKAGDSRSDKEVAQSLTSRGGLSNLGYSSDERDEKGRSSRGGQLTGGRTSFGLGASPSASATPSGDPGTKRPLGEGLKPVVGRSGQTQLSASPQAAQGSSPKERPDAQANAPIVRAPATSLSGSGEAPPPQPRPGFAPRALTAGPRAQQPRDQVISTSGPVRPRDADLPSESGRGAQASSLRQEQDPTPPRSGRHTAPSRAGAPAAATGPDPQAPARPRRPATSSSNGEDGPVWTRKPAAGPKGRA
jgi:hypothetical protein